MYIILYIWYYMMYSDSSRYPVCMPQTKRQYISRFGILCMSLYSEKSLPPSSSSPPPRWFSAEQIKTVISYCNTIHLHRSHSWLLGLRISWVLTKILFLSLFLIFLFMKADFKQWWWTFTCSVLRKVLASVSDPLVAF